MEFWYGPLEKINLKKYHLLIIGGTGFIGHHLALKGVKIFSKVTSISLNPPTKTRKVSGVNYIQLDLSKTENVNSFKWEDYEYVINLVGYIGHDLFVNGGRKYIDQHFTSLMNILETLPRKKIKKFIQIGSSDEYGDNTSPQNEIYREQPISPYSFSKVAATYFLQMLSKTENFPSLIVRLFLTYGPGQNNLRFIPQVIKGCLNGKSFPSSFGRQKRDFLFVEDAVDAIISLLKINNANGEIINVASGEAISIKEVMEKIRKLIGNGFPDYGKISYRKSESMDLYADINIIKELTNWEPKTDLNTGLIKTISWYKDNAIEKK